MFSMFHSARLKLTGFYLAILLCFSLTLTIGIRILAVHEFGHSDDVQRQTVSILERNAFGVSTEFLVPFKPMHDFANVQQNQNDLVQHHLNEDLIYLNLIALVVGGLLSYWYAGRTLKPIAKAHEAQRRFAADASHELRTPLANMQLENEVFLRQKSFTEDEARAQLASNLEEVLRLESLAGNLLALTQYEQASLDLHAVQVKKVLEKALEHSEKAMEARKITIDKTVSDAKVIGHEESLEQLFAIILDNAIKYGPEGGTIHVTGKRSGGSYALGIRDEGPGIADKDLPHIFDRLYRGDKARTTKAEGYGLGLSLAKQIAFANQASITAENSRAGGALFTVALDITK